MAAGDIKLFSEKYNPRPAIVLEGGDDAIQVNAWATDRQTAGDTVGTISAWVMPETKDATYTILAAGDTDADEFLDFSIVSGLLHLEISDAGTTDLDIESDAVVVEPHVWTHVAVVQNARQPRFYVNGKVIAATNDISTDLTCWFDQLSTLDAGNIGLLVANNTTTQDYAGGVGVVKHWNKALTADEIERDYLGTQQTAAADALQISKWDWIGGPVVGLTDKWVGANDGTVVSAAVIDGGYTSITSKLKEAATVVADDISISKDGDTLTAVVVKAA